MFGFGESSRSVGAWFKLGDPLEHQACREPERRLSDSDSQCDSQPEPEPEP